MSELLEKIPDNRNMNEAYKKVCANKGAGGVDGMELKEPLSMDSDQNMCSQGNLKRKAVAGGTCQLL